MFKKMEPSQTPVNYAHVKSLDGSVAKFTKAGGKIVMPKQEVGTGWVAVGVDPEGNPIGFWEPTPKPKRGSRKKSRSRSR